ncbi:MAG: hypothetical protein K0Q79_3513 [Flavipsychrobacter sp.]|jgi:hypothetical protein|nr:hypothetical protein [Flavipsychrobacter sp.]
MKKVFLTLYCLAITGIVTVNAQAPANQQPNAPVPAGGAPMAAPAPAAAPTPDPDAGVFKFKEETHDYGEVLEGPLAECEFTFKNTGKKPIVITEAHGSCGCTVPKWPTEPILPGKTGTIRVSYNTQGRQGPIMKDITINSNAKQQPMVLHIRGNVKPKPVDPNAPVAAPAPAPQPVPAANAPVAPAPQPAVQPGHEGHKH